jgi:hypothetical protein
VSDLAGLLVLALQVGGYGYGGSSLGPYNGWHCQVARDRTRAPSTALRASISFNHPLHVPDTKGQPG